MEALYTEEERLLRNTVKDFADSELAPLSSQWDQNEEFPWASLEALKRMDLMGMTIPSEYGGAGACYAEMCIASEEIARACMTTSTTHLTHMSLSANSVAKS